MSFHHPIIINEVINICITRNWRWVKLYEGADFVLLSVMSMLTLDAFALQTGSTSYYFTLTGDHEAQEEKENSRKRQCVCTGDCSDCLFQLGNSLHVLWITLNLYFIFVLIISVVICLENTSSFCYKIIETMQTFHAVVWVQHSFILGPNEKKLS